MIKSSANVYWAQLGIVTIMLADFNTGVGSNNKKIPGGKGVKSGSL